MRRLSFSAASLAFAVASAGACLGGCATTALELAPPRPDRPWEPETTAAGEIVAGAPGRAPERPEAGMGEATRLPAAAPYTLPANTALANVPPAAALDPAHAYTLPELIDLAESSHPSTRIAWNDARNAALAAGIAKSAYLPQISASALGGYQSGHGTVSTALGPLSSGTSTHGAVSVLSLQWLLFDFGERGGLVEAAEQASVASNIAFTAAHQRIIHEVSLAFYAYQAARVRASTAQQAWQNADAVLDAAQARYRQGIGTVLEVAQATQNRAQARLAQVQAEGAQSDTYLGLVSAIGISPLSRPKIAQLPARPLPPSLRRSVEQVVENAMASRPDVLARARNDAESASDRLTQARQEAVRQIVVSQNALESSLAAQEAATALAAAAQTTYEAAFAAYRRGVGTITDALLAQNQLLLARNAAADAYSGALAAAATLALATGSLGGGNGTER